MPDEKGHHRRRGARMADAERGEARGNIGVNTLELLRRERQVVVAGIAIAGVIDQEIELQSVFAPFPTWSTRAYSVRRGKRCSSLGGQSPLCTATFRIPAFEFLVAFIGDPFYRPCAADSGSIPCACCRR